MIRSHRRVSVSQASQIVLADIVWIKAKGFS